MIAEMVATGGLAGGKLFILGGGTVLAQPWTGMVKIPACFTWNIRPLPSRNQADQWDTAPSTVSGQLAPKPGSPRTPRIRLRSPIVAKSTVIWPFLEPK